MRAEPHAHVGPFCAKVSAPLRFSGCRHGHADTCPVPVPQRTALPAWRGAERAGVTALLSLSMHVWLRAHRYTGPTCPETMGRGSSTLPCKLPACPMARWDLRAACRWWGNTLACDTFRSGFPHVCLALCRCILANLRVYPHIFKASTKLLNINKCFLCLCQPPEITLVALTFPSSLRGLFLCKNLCCKQSGHSPVLK